MKEKRKKEDDLREVLKRGVGERVGVEEVEKWMNENQAN